MNKFNDVEAEMLGGGVVLFRNAIEIDWEWCLDFSKRGIAKEFDEMYTPVFDENKNITHFLNKSLYEFDVLGIEKMPKRFSSPHKSTEQKAVEILKFIEDSKDKYLLKYIEKYPIAYKNIWWKVKGHIVSYLSEHSSYLGEHSDTSTNYEYGKPHPPDQLASRNSVSALVYFNSSNKDFAGGDHYFTYLNINYSPNQGDILMFPSNYMAAHEVKPVTRGIRYSYLGWYCQGSPNPDYKEDVTDPVTSPDVAQYATNVYMPNLKNDVLAFLKSRSGNHSAINLVNGGRGGY